MKWDNEKIAEDVLALLYLTCHRSGQNEPWRAWKGQDWETLNLLFEKGFISDPKSKAKSVVLSDKGYSKAKELFERKYASEEPEPGGADNAG